MPCAVMERTAGGLARDVAAVVVVFRALTPRQAHTGAVLKLSWAHPEFGQVIASSSTDQRVLIWEEQGNGPWSRVAGWLKFAVELWWA